MTTFKYFRNILKEIFYHLFNVFYFREKVTKMSQNNLNVNSTNVDVTDTEILQFYNLATMTLLTSLEVRNKNQY